MKPQSLFSLSCYLDSSFTIIISFNCLLSFRTLFAPGYGVGDEGETLQAYGARLLVSLRVHRQASWHVAGREPLPPHPSRVSEPIALQQPGHGQLGQGLDQALIWLHEKDAGVGVSYLAVRIQPLDSPTFVAGAKENYP